jgi:hypothetical protein
MTDERSPAAGPAAPEAGPVWGRWKERLDAWLALPLTPLFLFLFLLAGYSTWEGLTSYITSTSGDIDPRKLAFVTVFTIALIVMMGVTLQGVVHSEGRLQRVGWFAAYLPLFLMSMCFAFAFWWTLMESKSATDRSVDVDYEQSIGTLTATQARLNSARSQLSQAAASFRTSAEIEQSRGGSCGVPSGKTRGPLTLLREGQAHKFEEMATNLERVSVQVGGLIDAVRNNTKALVDRSRAQGTPPGQRLQDLNLVRERLTRVSGLVNAQIEPLPAQATELEQDARAHSTVDAFSNPATGERLTCLDSGGATQLRAAATSLKAVKRLPDVKFEVFQESTATVEAISRFLNQFGLGALIGASGDAGLDRRDTLPFVMALVVDAGLFLIGLRRGHGASLGPLERARRREERRQRRRDSSAITPTEMARERARLAAMFGQSFGGSVGELLVNRRGWSFIVVPTEIEGPARRRAAALLRFLESFPRRNSPLFELTHWHLLRSFHDRRAQALLAARNGLEPTEADPQAPTGPLRQGAGTDWAAGAGFRWFRVDWRRAHQFAEALHAWEDEALVHGELVGEADDEAGAQARANRAEARRERMRAAFEAEETLTRAHAELRRAQAEAAGGDLRFQVEQQARRLREFDRRRAEADAQERSEQAEHEGSVAHLEALAAVVAERTAADSEAVLARLRKEAESIRRRARETEESEAPPAEDEAFRPRSTSRLAHFMEELADRFRRRRRG